MTPDEMKAREINTFGNYKFPNWVSVEVAQQIMDFWGCFRRTHKEWLENASLYNKKHEFPELGTDVIFFSRKPNTDLYEKIEGKFIHAWNNMGRVILEDKTCKVVSSCDFWLFKNTFHALHSVREEAFAKGQEKKASCICTATKLGDTYCELHRPMFERAIHSERKKERERCLDILEKADPLCSEGPYWENAETDEIAYGVQKYLVGLIREQEDL